MGAECSSHSTAISHQQRHISSSTQLQRQHQQQQIFHNQLLRQTNDKAPPSTRSSKLLLMPGKTTSPVIPDVPFSVSPNHMLNERDVQLLRDTYDKIKLTDGLRSQLALDSMNMIIARVPEALQSFHNNNTEHANDDKWSLTRQGYKFLDGIEQALAYADRPATLRHSLIRLGTYHRQRFGVSTYMMVEAVDSFESVIISYLQSTHCHRSMSLASSTNTSNLAALSTLDETTEKSCSDGRTISNIVILPQGFVNSTASSMHSEDTCQICGTWTRFLGLLRTVIASSAPEYETETQLSMGIP